jgi:hypothetical protein
MDHEHISKTMHINCTVKQNQHDIFRYNATAQGENLFIKCFTWKMTN